MVNSIVIKTVQKLAHCRRRPLLQSSLTIVAFSDSGILFKDTKSACHFHITLSISLTTINTSVLFSYELSQKSKGRKKQNGSKLSTARNMIFAVTRKARAKRKY